MKMIYGTESVDDTLIVQANRIAELEAALAKALTIIAIGVFVAFVLTVAMLWVVL